MSAENPFEMPSRYRLYREPRRGWLAGVCAGIADYFGLPPAYVRIAWLFSLFFFFVPTLIGYVVLALALKPKPSDLYRSREEEALRRSIALGPRQSFAGLRRRFRDLEQRLARIEAHVTADEFELRRKFREL